MTRSKEGNPGQRSALIVTHLIKLGGIALGIHEGFQATPDARIIALAAFMLAGARISRELMIEMLSRFFGVSSKDPK